MGRREGAVKRFGPPARNLGPGAIHLPRAGEKNGVPGRRKLPGADDPASPQFVVTRRGLGYLFNA